MLDICNNPKANAKIVLGLVYSTSDANVRADLQKYVVAAALYWCTLSLYCGGGGGGFKQQTDLKGQFT